MATTFLPTYAVPSHAVPPRGGGLHLDLDCATGTMQRDANGRPALARGQQRLVSRIVRALLTPLGSWWADPEYGSAAVPGLSVSGDIALQVSGIALRESRRYSQATLAPDERISQVTVHAVQPGDSPRELLVDITITTVAGTAHRVPFLIEH